MFYDFHVPAQFQWIDNQKGRGRLAITVLCRRSSRIWYKFSIKLPKKSIKIQLIKWSIFWGYWRSAPCYSLCAPDFFRQSSVFQIYRQSWSLIFKIFKFKLCKRRIIFRAAAGSASLFKLYRNKHERYWDNCPFYLRLFWSEKTGWSGIYIHIYRYEIESWVGFPIYSYSIFSVYDIQLFNWKGLSFEKNSKFLRLAFHISLIQRIKCYSMKRDELAAKKINYFFQFNPLMLVIQIIQSHLVSIMVRVLSTEVII